MINLILAGLVLDIGVAIHPVKDFDDNRYSERSNPLGIVVIGYQHKNVFVYAEHSSSIPDKDENHGLNLIGVKYRFSLD